MPVAVHVIQARWSEHLDTLRAIRHKVFIEEQEVPQELEWDGLDEDSTHFLAVNELGQYLGCARLLASGQIGRMAVLEAHRGTGVGALLLDAAVETGQQMGFDRLYLHAQSYAEPFYRKGGFLPFGDEFEEAGIAHISMEMKLAVAFEPSPEISYKTPDVRPQEVRDTLNEQPSVAQPFQGPVECRQGLLKVIQSARRRLLILNPYLDHELFDQAEIAAAISALARSAPKVEVQILIFDAKLIVDRGHQLVELARRLDEKIKIRLLPELPNAESSSFVCADLDAYWLLPSYDTYAGVTDLANPVTTKRLTDAFNTAWGKSKDDPELRELRL